MAPRSHPAHLRLLPRSDDGAPVDGARTDAESTRESAGTELEAPRELGASVEARPAQATRRGKVELSPLADAPAGPASIRRAGGLSSLTDAQLVGIAREGDAAAFEALYRRHIAFALHLAARIEGSSRDVEDVVHDAFIKAFGRIGDLSEPAAFRSWLGSIVVFAVRSRLRRQRLLGLLGLGRGSEPVELDSLASADASPHLRAQLAQIYALLRTQPTDDRIAWTLRYVEGNELEAVAKLVGCSLATVKRRISRAQKFLEDHFVPATSEDDSDLGAVDAPHASPRPSEVAGSSQPLRPSSPRSPSR